MKIGLYFGSFNPIHIGHLIVGSYVSEYTDVDEVWFVVSPHNPLKPASALLDATKRLDFVRIAIEHDKRLRASDVEFNLPRPSYTIDTLTYLAEEHPEHIFSIVVGSDSYQNLDTWKNGALLKKQYHFIVYQRPGTIITQEVITQENITLLDAPLLQISATQIRAMILQKKNIRYLVPEKVRCAIAANGYYQ